MKKKPKKVRQAGTLEVLRTGVNRKSVRIVPSPTLGGLYTEEGGVVTLTVPPQRSAYARVVRVHEALHANTKDLNLKKLCPDIHPKCEFAVDDAYIHSLSVWDHASKSLKRDVASVALRDLRRLWLDDAPKVDWNSSVLIAIRSMAIVYQVAGRAWKLAESLMKKIFKSTPTVPDTILSGIRYVRFAAREASWPFKRRYLRKAVEILNPLFIDEEDEKRRQRRYDPQADASSKVGSGNCPMEIVRLPLTTRTSSRKKAVTKLSHSGLLLNHRRLVNACVNMSTARLFRKRVRLETGAVLIDASGSMGMSSEELRELCSLVPAAVVAYYCGENDDYGKLYVYAEKGMRFNDTPPRCGENNTVDYWALKWLLSRPESPKVIVTDGGFCGGPDWQAGAAMRLLLQAVNRGEVRWVQTVEEAIELFKSGDLA